MNPEGNNVADESFPKQSKTELYPQPKQSDLENDPVTRRRLILRNPRHAVVLLAVLLLASPADAQDGRPGPEPPNPPADAVAETDQPQPPNQDNAPATPNHTNGRRPPKDDKVKLFFKDASVGKDEIIAFIVETTGKVVMPVNINTLKARPGRSR